MNRGLRRAPLNFGLLARGYRRLGRWLLSISDDVLAGTTVIHLKMFSFSIMLSFPSESTCFLALNDQIQFPFQLDRKSTISLSSFHSQITYLFHFLSKTEAVTSDVPDYWGEIRHIDHFETMIAKRTRRHDMIFRGFQWKTRIELNKLSKMLDYSTRNFIVGLDPIKFLTDLRSFRIRY